MLSLAASVRHAIRTLLRNRGYATAAVVTLGLGLGATASIYTLVQRVVLDPLPYPDATQLVRVRNPVPGVKQDQEWNLSSAQYFYYRDHVPALAALGTYGQGGINIATGTDPRRGQMAIVTASMMRLLGARAHRGRLIEPADDQPGAPTVALVSYGFWRAQLGGDEAIIGRTISLDDQPAVVIGVMARDVELPPERGEALSIPTDVWIPIRLNPAGPFYNNHTLPAVGRLAAGATAEAAQRQINRLLPELPQVFPNAYSQQFFDRYGFHTTVYPLRDFVLGDMARTLWILFGAVGLVLLIACANVGNLFLVRLEARRREFSVRLALGAARKDLAREAFSEGLVLALTGAAIALALSWLSARWLVALSPPGIPRLEAVRPDWHVVSFTAIVALAIAAVLALVPLLQHRDVAGVAALAEGGRSASAGVQRQRVRSTLVVAQMAFALVLVVASGLLLQSFRRLRALDPGIDPDGVLTAEWYLPPSRFDSPAKVWSFTNQVLTNVRAIPGVVAAGTSEELPFVTGFGCTVQGFEEQVVFDRIKAAGLTTCAGQAPTSPGYFESLRIPLVAGRYFTDADNLMPDRGAAIVTKAFAERFWPGEDPIGKGVKPNGRTTPPFHHVVGVVGDLHGQTLQEAPAMGVFYPLVPLPGVNWYPNVTRLVVRTSRADPHSLLSGIRSAVAAVDPTIPLANAESMQAIVDRSMARLSFTMMLLAIAGGVALMLAAVGLYGLISYVVARRTNEIGVRIALGAQAGQVERLVVTRALGLSLMGLAVGIAGAAASTRVLRGLLYGVTPWDPGSYAGAVLVLVIAAAFAGWIPARRAARVDPAVALRSE